MKTLPVLLAAALILPEAVLAVTSSQSNNYAQQGVSLKLYEPAGSVYQQGESVRFSMTSDTDAYAVVFDIDTDGYVNLLYPRQANSIQRILAHQPYDIPSDPTRELLVSGNPGIEFVFAVSTADRGAINEQEVAFFLAEEGKPFNARYRVTGDPFLAANRIASRLIQGIAYKRDESIAYSYFYVDDAVDFPRYLCGECESQMNDPSAMVQWVPTTAFDQEDHLSYPLASAFARSETVSENPAAGKSTTTYVYNYYRTGYPYTYYPGYWGSPFYFSIGWNWNWWGVGWSWGYPYYPYPAYRYGYACYPYASPYCWTAPRCYYGGYGTVAYRSTIRPDSPYRYKNVTTASLRFTPKGSATTSVRTKTASVQRSDKLRGSAVGGTRVSLKSTGSRPVAKATPRSSVGSTRSTTATRTHSTTATRTRATAPMRTRSKTATHSGVTRSKSSSSSQWSRPIRSLKGQTTPRQYISGRKYTLQRPTTGTRSVFRGTTPTVGQSTRGKTTFGKPAVNRGTRSSSPTVRRSSGRSATRSTPARSSARSTSRGRRK